MSRELSRTDLKVLSKIPLSIRRQLTESLNFDSFEDLVLAAFETVQSCPLHRRKSAMKFLNQSGGKVPINYQTFLIALILVSGILSTMYYYNVSYSPELIKKIEHCKVLIEDVGGIIIEQIKIPSGYGRMAPLQRIDNFFITDTKLKSQMEFRNITPPTISMAQYKEGVRNQTLKADKITNDIIFNIWSVVSAMIAGILMLNIFNVKREKRAAQQKFAHEQKALEDKQQALKRAYRARQDEFFLQQMEQKVDSGRPISQEEVDRLKRVGKGGFD